MLLVNWIQSQVNFVSIIFNIFQLFKKTMLINEHSCPAAVCYIGSQSLVGLICIFLSPHNGVIVLSCVHALFF